MTKKILIIITVLALIVRIVYSDTYPPLLWDEASLGYNAYSIIKTGHDEYGKFLPYIFKSFGDYKPGLYAYLAAPFVSVLGLNPLAVRLPSIILGSLTPLLIYLLILQLSPKSNRLGLIAATIIAFNPWNIHYSRGAWETNVLVFELVAACYFYLKPKYFLSAIFFAATLYTYQGGKIMSPLLIFILFTLNYKQIFTQNNLLKFVFPLFILALPIFYGLLFQSDSNRLQVFGLWSYHQPTEETAQIIKESSQLDFQVFHNSAIFFLRNFLTRYFNHFSPRFLAFQGDWQIGRQAAPYIGVLLFPTFILFIYGIFSAFTGKITKINLFFLLWLLVGPLPAALTIDIIQPVRTLSLSLPLIYFAAYAADMLITKYKYVFTITLIFSYLLTFIYYGDLYLNHLVKVKPDHSLFGYQPAMEFTISHMNGKQVTFTDYYGQAYIYFLFQSKYDPSTYQHKSKLISSGLDVGKIESIDNITFKTPDFNIQKKLPHQLMIFSYEDVLRQGIDPKSLIQLSPINGHSSFYAYETN